MKKAVGFTILGVSLIVLLVLRFNNVRADDLETGTLKADNVIEELVEVIEEDDEIIEETVKEEVTVEIETEKEIEDVEIEDVEIVEEQSIDLPVTGNTQAVRETPQAVQAQEPAAPRRQEVQQTPPVQEAPEVEQVSEPVVVKPEVPATPKYTPNSLYINGEKVAGIVSGNVVTGISSIPVGTVMITDASGEGRNVTVGAPFEVSASNTRFDSGDDVSVLLNGNAGVVFILQQNEFVRLVAQGY